MMINKLDKPRLLIISYYEPGTGFYCVIENISKQLFKDFEIHYIGIGYKGPPVKMGYWNLYPAIFLNGDFGARCCFELMELLHSGSLLIINDIWVIGAYKEIPTNLKSLWRVLAYVPVDGTIIDSNLFLNYQFIDQLVVYTNFARCEIERHKKLLNDKKLSLTFPSVDVIPHGVDNSFFFVE